ncbi:melanocyte-stimulating hormone receptor [Hydra vulgaris]|uniref:Melanocyte-stimulating hormone receptor n=1 Tax=Hydra vulgaris TaxID=6087 RepID=A0ABM4CSM4_HYDVU
MNSSTKCKFLYPEVDGNYGQLPIIVFTSVSMCISIPGNIITGLTILRNFKLRSEPAYLLICSVCVADTLVGAAAQPFLITATVLGMKRSCILDRVYFVLAWLSSCASTLGVMTITIDRYLYIVHPMNYTILMTQQRATIMIFIVWFTSLLFATMPIIYYNMLALHITALSVFIFITSFMTYTYGKVYFKLKVPSTSLPFSRIHGRKTKVRTQASRTILMVVIGFFGCWYPWVIISLLVALSKQQNSSKANITPSSFIIKLYWIFLTLGYSNSALNVFIYSRKNTILRKAVEKFLGLKIRNSTIVGYSLEKEETKKSKLNESKSTMADLTDLCRRFARLNRVYPQKSSNKQVNSMEVNNYVERTDSICKVDAAILNSSLIFLKTY